MLTFLILVTITASISNAIMDNIDFHFSDRLRSMKDFWHIMKYVWGVCLISVGAIGSHMVWRLDFDLLAYGVVLIGSKFLWDHLFYNYTAFFVNIDETLKIKTGIAWLDRLLGLDK